MSRPSRMASLWSLAFFAIAAGAAGPTRAVVPPSLPTASPADTAEASTPLGSPLAVIADLERAWGSGDVEAVLACMSLEALELALERCGGPPTGRFARAQAEFLIRDLLHYGESVSFRIIDFEWKENGPRARAEWKHRMASGETRAELDMELAREAGAWRVVRIAAR